MLDRRVPVCFFGTLRRFSKNFQIRPLNFFHDSFFPHFPVASEKGVPKTNLIVSCAEYESPKINGLYLFICGAVFCRYCSTFVVYIAPSRCAFVLDIFFIDVASQFFVRLNLTNTEILINRKLSIKEKLTND